MCSKQKKADSVDSTESAGGCITWSISWNDAVYRAESSWLQIGMQILPNKFHSRLLVIALAATGCERLQEGLDIEEVELVISDEVGDWILGCECLQEGLHIEEVQLVVPVEVRQAVVWSSEGTIGVDTLGVDIVWAVAIIGPGDDDGASGCLINIKAAFAAGCAGDGHGSTIEEGTVGINAHKFENAIEIANTGVRLPIGDTRHPAIDADSTGGGH